MYRWFVGILVCALLVVGVSFARAQDANTDASTTEPAAAEPAMEDPARTLTTEEIESQKQRRVFYTPLVKDRTKNLLDNVMNRLKTAADRFDRIASRIESRIQKEEAAGRDGMVAREALLRARNEIARAEREASMITELQMDLVVDSASPRASFQNLSIRIIATHTALVNAKRELSHALSAISGATIPSPEDAGTTTDETATTTSDI